MNGEDVGGEYLYCMLEMEAERREREHSGQPATDAEVTRGLDSERKRGSEDLQLVFQFPWSLCPT